MPRVIVTDLAQAGYLVKDNDGRRNRYRVQEHLPLGEAVGQERTIGEVLELLVDTIPAESRGSALTMWVLRDTRPPAAGVLPHRDRGVTSCRSKSRGRLESRCCIAVASGAAKFGAVQSELPGRLAAIDEFGARPRSLRQTEDGGVPWASCLVDELRLMVFPTLLGHGKRLFPDGIDRLKLKLVESQQVGSDGVQVLVYRRAS